MTPFRFGLAISIVTIAALVVVAVAVIVMAPKAIERRSRVDAEAAAQCRFYGDVLGDPNRDPRWTLAKLAVIQERYDQDCRLYR
jgi:hypothetical protein